jgi:hypothetical protein
MKGKSIFISNENFQFFNSLYLFELEMLYCINLLNWEIRYAL